MLRKYIKLGRYNGEVNMILILFWLPSFNIAPVLGKELSTFLTSKQLQCFAGDKVDNYNSI